MNGVWFPLVSGNSFGFSFKQLIFNCVYFVDI